MAQAVHGPLSFLNTDGRPHPRENALALVTLVLGTVAFIFGFLPDLNMVAAWVGLIGLPIGAYAQMISATTAERFLVVIGLGGAGVGFYLGMANGGLFG
ncbi:hypothetical protein [Streptomyces sp. YIM 98790]|uniref:hypothetical protein n=1 Tax=Streptomyces sp. YIM 98790 TaxID=2689077 RepID=UPI00140B797C|nr:hypothetical protein [Streptomyces sp. YIM 98790]